MPSWSRRSPTARRSRAGTILPHRVLLERVWGSEWAVDPNYLKVFVRRLRQKLGDDAARPRYIQTDWGVGYRLVGHRNRNGYLPGLHR